MENPPTPSEMAEKLNVGENPSQIGHSVEVNKAKSEPIVETRLSQEFLATKDKISKQYLVELAAFAQTKQEAHFTKHWIHLPSIATFRKLRQYNIEHIARELDEMADKVFDLREATSNDLDRLRVLLHEQGIQ